MPLCQERKHLRSRPSFLLFTSCALFFICTAGDSTLSVSLLTGSDDKDTEKKYCCVGYFSVCPSFCLAPFLKRPLSVTVILFFVVFCPTTFLFGFMPTMERFPKYAIQVEGPSLLQILCFDSERISVVNKYFKMLQHMKTRQ